MHPRDHDPERQPTERNIQRSVLVTGRRTPRPDSPITRSLSAPRRCRPAWYRRLWCRRSAMRSTATAPTSPQGHPTLNNALFDQCESSRTRPTGQVPRPMRSRRRYNRADHRVAPTSERVDLTPNAKLARAKRSKTLGRLRRRCAAPAGDGASRLRPRVRRRVVPAWPPCRPCCGSHDRRPRRSLWTWAETRRG